MVGACRAAHALLSGELPTGRAANQHILAFRCDLFKLSGPGGRLPTVRHAVVCRTLLTASSPRRFSRRMAIFFSLGVLPYG
eukprot:5377251-Prymnesium_polylepis.1